MYRICLIDMPFASIQIPSTALTQIKSILESSLSDKVAVEVLYPKNDCALHFGPVQIGPLFAAELKKAADDEAPGDKSARKILIR